MKLFGDNTKKGMFWVAISKTEDERLADSIERNMHNIVCHIWRYGYETDNYRVVGVPTRTKKEYSDLVKMVETLKDSKYKVACKFEED